MINLLPPEQIQQLKEEKQLKIILHFGIFLFFFLLSFFLVLFSNEIQLNGILESETILFQKGESMLDLDLEQEIKNYNTLLKKINTFQEQKVYLLPILEKISQDIPEKIFINNLSLELKPKEGILVSFSGISKDRETFSEFIRILNEKYPEFHYSQESLLKQTEIDFSVSFKIK